MNNILSNILATVFGGLIVATASYYLFGERAIRSNVEVAQSIEYGREVGDEQTLLASLT